MAKMDLNNLEDQAKKLVNMLETRDDWQGTMSGNIMFHDILNEIRWEIDGEESEILRQTGLLGKFQSRR